MDFKVPLLKEKLGCYHLPRILSAVATKPQLVACPGCLCNFMQSVDGSGVFVPLFCPRNTSLLFQAIIDCKFDLLALPHVCHDLSSHWTEVTYSLRKHRRHQEMRRIRTKVRHSLGSACSSSLLYCHSELTSCHLSVIATKSRMDDYLGSLIHFVLRALFSDCS